MPTDRLAVFETDSGITVAFGERTYFIKAGDPFHNIARKSLERNDYVPFYIYMARQEGVGEQFRDELRAAIRELRQGSGREDGTDIEDDEDWEGGSPDDWRVT
jgi:hypothetical protein